MKINLVLFTYLGHFLQNKVKCYCPPTASTVRFFSYEPVRGGEFSGQRRAQGTSPSKRVQEDLDTPQEDFEGQLPVPSWSPWLGGQRHILSISKDPCLQAEHYRAICAPDYFRRLRRHP